MSTFSKETFWSLLSNKGGIVIPIIQRAYTQGGRGNDEAVAKKGDKFLQYLLDALLGVTPAVELDFIYGTIENDKVQPLDGQQRLTTLFLIHWYVAQKENRLSDEVKCKLNKFSYETRVSSRSFCGKLCEFLVPTPDSRSLPEIIEDQGWFVLSWKNDPSVLSMLGMLGKIHERLNDAPSETSLWDIIIDKAPITFFYTPLEAFNLTDDLYIRMNARGKELTAFEAFKATIEKKIDDGDWDAGKPVADTFGNQMDNEWSDLFWRFRDKHNQIDRYVLRLFAAVLIGHYAGRDNAKAVRLFNTPESLTAEDFDRDSYDCLYETLNLFHTAGKHLKETAINSAFFWLWGDRKPVLKSFGDFVKLFIAHESETGKMTWQQLALFHGVAVYLRNNSNTAMANFADWLRFVRNILTSQTVDDIEPFVSAMKRLDEMAKGSGDIYDYLAGIPAANGFSHEQMKEEFQKAIIYQNTPGAKPIIQAIEECNFCRGRVSFVFRCLGINDSVPDIDKLEKMKEIALVHLSDSDISNDFRRALLTIDDNSFYTYWRREAHTSKCPEAYGSPVFRLIENMADLRDYSKGGHMRYLRQLLEALLQSSLTDLLANYQASDTTPRWVVKMIKDKNILDRDNARYVIVGKDKAWTRQAKKSQYPLPVYP
jgi:hypothetical protein